jgi:4-hydroxy 2-oxovalerate aldolase
MANDKFQTILLDCTLRDGGYYNDWNFPLDLVNDYLLAMRAVQVDIVELGFRFLDNVGFKGPYAFTTDEHLRSLEIPVGLKIAVMVNGTDLCAPIGRESVLNLLFPEHASTSPVDMVRIACHYRELHEVYPATAWLAERGYRVGLNLMQVTDRTDEELRSFGNESTKWPIDVLYFADSIGGMRPQDINNIVKIIRTQWNGPLGIHTHDNLGLGLANTLQANQDGVSWLDSTVTGMGRGPGNTRTEELIIEIKDKHDMKCNLVLLMALIRNHFKPMKDDYGWGTNPYYYLSGKYGIHPTFIQEMLWDKRFDEVDILAVIDRLKCDGAKKFSYDAINSARNFYRGSAYGTWVPASLLQARDVLIIGGGPSVKSHCNALEAFIRRRRPVVIALNTNESIASDLIDLRAASHPVRLLADAHTHCRLPQPLITPLSMLPDSLISELEGKNLLDFGISIDPEKFSVFESYCVIPTPLVLAYALAVAASGKVDQILLAGFDGYSPGDPRNEEVESVFKTFATTRHVNNIISITPTIFKNLTVKSLYGQ